MRLFDLIKRPSRSAAGAQLPVKRELPAPQDTPEEVAVTSKSAEDVRQLLFDAIAGGDEARVIELCREHAALIAQHGPIWAIPPVELSENPAAADWYARGLRDLLNIRAA
jgi:hypothetical protein